MEKEQKIKDYLYSKLTDDEVCFLDQWIDCGMSKEFGDKSFLIADVAIIIRTFVTNEKK